jgi:diguanylate cyclase (GGDEF)-like protein
MALIFCGKTNPMTSQIISRPELDKFLSIHALQQRNGHSPDEPPFKELLAWMDKKQNGQTLLERKCQPGEIIIHEGERGDVFYIIRSGLAIVIKGEVETPTVIGFRTTGDTIGEMALLENRPRSATVIALQPVLLWKLERDTFHQFLTENPALSLNLMSILSGRIREADEERLSGTIRERQKEEVLEDLSKLAAFDPLTGLYNRRQMDEILRAEALHAIQYKNVVGIIMADIDHFKNINDTYGHHAGDLMLQAVARILKESVRTADSVCRYGGEEFVIILPGASLNIIERIAKKIRTRFEKYKLEYEGQTLRATISLGAASFPQHASSLAEVIQRADQALYQAKRGGRNRVMLYSDDN